MSLDAEREVAPTVNFCPRKIERFERPSPPGEFDEPGNSTARLAWTEDPDAVMCFPDCPGPDVVKRTNLLAWLLFGRTKEICPVPVSVHNQRSNQPDV